MRFLRGPVVLWHKIKKDYKDKTITIEKLEKLGFVWERARGRPKKEEAVSRAESEKLVEEEIALQEEKGMQCPLIVHFWYNLALNCAFSCPLFPRILDSYSLHPSQ